MEPLTTRIPLDGYRVYQDEVLPPPPPMAEPEHERETSDSLTTESLLHGKRAAPGSGWRRSVYRATGGLLRLGESAAEMRRRDLINRVRTPVAGGHHRIAVLSLKGGVGKTTTAVGLGATLATLRGDRVIAVDANPDRGTLSDKVRLDTVATIRDLLNERDQVSRYADVRAFTSQAPSRLEVLASDRDPRGVGRVRRRRLRRRGPGARALLLDLHHRLRHRPAALGHVRRTAAGRPDHPGQLAVGGRRPERQRHPGLAGGAQLRRPGAQRGRGALGHPAEEQSTVDLDRLEHHFASRCRAVARIPYDPHLEEGAEIELEMLSSDTAEAYLALAAVVGDGLARPRRLTARSALP